MSRRDWEDEGKEVARRWPKHCAARDLEVHRVWQASLGPLSTSATAEGPGVHRDGRCHVVHSHQRRRTVSVCCALVAVRCRRIGCSGPVLGGAWSIRPGDRYSASEMNALTPAGSG